ncbi:fatty acyl-CoA reductase wat [Dendroctonus ponderosae]|nr:fatty acyl-CoA reductase wat [Dendroctonus ponderosae]
MAEGNDRIGEIFKGKTVFLSGATGFLGKMLIEKLLRVTEVKTLYLLIRQKKGKSPKDRLQDIFNHVLFSTVKKTRPDCFKKCVVVTGDVLETELGLLENDRKTMVKEVDFIFHSAASTRFDDTLEYAIRMNTLGTKYMLNFAKQCQKLKLFEHISTAFAFPNEKVLHEKTYDPPADPQQIIEMTTASDPEAKMKLPEKKIMGNYPNTYSYSKALAEGLVNQQMETLPAIIVRPAVVIPTFKEPLPGYFNNLQSPMGLFVGAGKGVIRSVYMDSKTSANVIPADSCINVILLAVWDYLTTKRQPVFNICVPREDLTVNWEQILDIGRDIVSNEIPFNVMLWCPGGIMTKNKIFHYIHVVLFQLIPAVFVDLLLICLGYKPVLVSVNQRLLKGQDLLEYYTTRAWKFDMRYFMNLRKTMNDVEKRIYQVEAENVDIAEYLRGCMMYARRHILHETDEMMPAAKRNLKIFVAVDRILKATFFIVLFYYVYRLLNF